MRSTAAVLTLAVLIGLGTPAMADTVIVKKMTTEGIPGRGDKPENGTIWLGENKMRQDRAEMSLIVNLDANKMYFVNHEKKSYSGLDLPIDMMSMIPEESRQQMKQMAEQMNMKVEVTPTDETAEVAGYDARLYKIKLSNAMGMSMDIDLWAAKPAGLDVANYKKMYESILSAQPFGADWAKELMELDGFGVKVVNHINAMGSQFTGTEEVVSIEQKDAPAGTYDPPAGYEETPFDFMSSMAGMGGM